MLKRLLIFTQKVDKNDSVLGFFNRWIIEFAKHFDSVLVVCLEKKDYVFPENVIVYSLGKETGVSRLKYLYNFYRYILLLRNKYDFVFIHMNPEYLCLGGILWRIMKKKTVLWYTHKAVNIKLYIAQIFAHSIFTASTKSFRIKNKKVNVMNHGIDTDFFIPNIKLTHSIFRILSLGRISRIKNHLLIIRACNQLLVLGIPMRLVIVGGAITFADCEYLSLLKKEVLDLNMSRFVEFVGPVSHADTVNLFQNVDVYVNASETGSLDKAVLESMACGTLVVSSNDSVVQILSKYNQHLVFPEGDMESLVKNLIFIAKNKTQFTKLSTQIRQEVVDCHGLSRLISRMCEQIQNL